jgi:hypothetical protein
VSSNAYSASLTPDPWLRILVLTSGRLLIAAGLVLILNLAVDTGLRFLGCLVWGAFGRFELKRLQQGFDACSAIRVDSNGEFSVLKNHDNWVPASLMTGSALLRKLGWMRLQDETGQVFLELIRGDARQSQDWRRLQVIWRHIGA